MYWWHPTVTSSALHAFRASPLPGFHPTFHGMDAINDPSCFNHRLDSTLKEKSTHQSKPITLWNWLETFYGIHHCIYVWNNICSREEIPREFSSDFLPIGIDHYHRENRPRQFSTSLFLCSRGNRSISKWQVIFSVTYICSKLFSVCIFSGIPQYDP